MKKLLVLAAIAAATVALSGQGVNRDLLHKPLAEAWPTYSGDYSGKRYSAATQINQTNVKALTLAWTRRLTAGAGPSGPPTPGEPPVIAGGEGDVVFGGATTVKGSILAINGVLYVTAPDNVWALDANDGHLLWRYFWKTKGGTHIGNRGAGMWGNYLFFVTPDNYLVSLEAKTGAERWHKELASFQQQYFHTMAPVFASSDTR
jgi:alcohol dehydrogenase (cytochrome c)